MPTSAKRPASRSPDGERRPKRHLTSSPPEEGELDDEQVPPPTTSLSLPAKPSPAVLVKGKMAIPFPFKKKEPPAVVAKNVFDINTPVVHDRPKDDNRRPRDDPKRKAPRPSEPWDSTSNRHQSSARNHRASSPRRSKSPYSRPPINPEVIRYRDSSPRWAPPDDRGRDSRRYNGPDTYRDRPYRDSRDDPRAWTRRDEQPRRDRDSYDHYSGPRDDFNHYRPISPHNSYRPVSPRGAAYRPVSPRPPLSPPRTRHSPAQPPPPTSSPPPPPPPDARLLPRDAPPPRDAPLPPPPASLPPRPPAPLDMRSPPSMVRPPASRPPQSEVRKEPVREMVRIALKPPPPRRSQAEEEKAYGRVFKGCGNKNEYEITTKLGEGTFGEVHKAIHISTRRSVALKRILMHNEKEGMPVTALREIKILKALNHPCIVNILDMFVVRSTATDPLSVYMVFPYMDHDLAGLLENERVKLQPSHIKLYMKQLLEGTEYMHRNHILHRDMKAANLLISNSGSLLIADFGLARAFDSGDNPNREGKERKYTNCVVTRWYRPPELLLGARQYGGEVDMWGIGCVLGEMFMRRPILPGTSDLDQLEKIWRLCGSPNQHSWPNFERLPGCEGVTRFESYPRKLTANYEHIGKETCDLMDRLLTCNPRQRITAAQALDHDYFWTAPMPADPKSLPTYEASHEFDKRGHRQHQQQQQHQQGGPPPQHLDQHRQYRPPGPGGMPPQHHQQQQHQQHPPPHQQHPPNPNNWPRPNAYNQPPGYGGGPPPRYGPDGGGPPARYGPDGGGPPARYGPDGGGPPARYGPDGGPPPRYGPGYGGGHGHGHGRDGGGQGRGPPPGWQPPRNMGGGGGGTGTRPAALPAGLPPKPVAPQGGLPPPGMNGMNNGRRPPGGGGEGGEALNYG